MKPENPTYWRRKLSALLHDSPDKVIDIVDHENRAKVIAQAEGLGPEETAHKTADFAASAADRLPWPKSKLGDEILCRSDFDATNKALHHPLGGSAIQFDRGFVTADQGLDVSHATRPRLSEDDPRAACITAWRFWQNWASAADERFACLPAETRLPDHTIWNHLTVTSALQGCYGGSLKDWHDAKSAGKKPSPPPDRPAFLLFSIGPVQEFIAAARNTRDLWSGSYLLSYLIGTALQRVALDFGPDHVIFPNLVNQPILDLLLKGDLWDSVRAADGTELWKAFRYYSAEGIDRLLTPSLPNRFLAIMPAEMNEHERWKQPDANNRRGAARYAAELEKVIRQCFREIGVSVCDRAKRVSTFDADRFTKQVERSIEIYWQVLPWPGTIDEAMLWSGNVPGEKAAHPLDSVKDISGMLNRMPENHRDPRNFRNVGSPGQAGPLGQVSNAWSALYALASWQLDAVKNIRAFDAWSNGGWQVSKAHNKDSLNGKEEVCLAIPTDKNEAKQLSRKLTDEGEGNASNENVFKAGDLLGASTLIKRLWHRTWLAKKHPFKPEDFAMPNTRSVAGHEPFASSADEDPETEEEAKYFAILALDGDEMGKWISGVKCPPLDSQLSEEAKRYFGKYNNAEFLKARRPLAPSFHLQFSELLANFGLHCARRIVEAFDGRLIYSGGDDVLAMLPADSALPCARALRAAFRGERQLGCLARGKIRRGSAKRENWRSDLQTALFEVKREGFVKLTPEAASEGYGANAGLLDEPVTFPFIVPGPATDCSVGIAIGHYKAPLQDLVRAAQAAEKRAKRKPLDRGAVAVTLFKRSGETIEWGCRWDSGGLEAFEAVLEGIKRKVVSRKFPHRLVELVARYQTDDREQIGGTKCAAGFAEVASAVLSKEIGTALERQKGEKYIQEEANKLREQIERYLASITNPAEKVRCLIGLCQTSAFTGRNLLEEASHPVQGSTGIDVQEPEPTV